jgi:dodecin
VPEIALEKRSHERALVHPARLRRRPPCRDKENDMSVYRVIDVIGTSTTSWEDAAMTAVTTAKGTLRDVRVAEVVKQDLDVGDDDQVTYRIKLQLSFKYEGGPA